MAIRRPLITLTGRRRELPLADQLALDILRISTWRLHHSVNQTYGSTVRALLNWDDRVTDPYNWHFTSNAALTGTVSKTATSNVINGVSTLFTTELSPGQVVDIPGTVTERVVVAQINSNTQFLSATNLANTASGQTATRTNQAIAVQEAGFYGCAALAAFTAGSTVGYRELVIVVDGVRINTNRVNAVAAANTFMAVPSMFMANKWSRIEVEVYQDSGVALDVVASTTTSPIFVGARLA